MAGGLTPVSRLGLFRRKRWRNVAGKRSRCAAADLPAGQPRRAQSAAAEISIRAFGSAWPGRTASLEAASCRLTVSGATRADSQPRIASTGTCWAPTGLTFPLKQRSRRRLTRAAARPSCRAEPPGKSVTATGGTDHQTLPGDLDRFRRRSTIQRLDAGQSSGAARCAVLGCVPSRWRATSLAAQWQGDPARRTRCAYAAGLLRVRHR